MAVNRSILDRQQEYTSWRRELHRHPELAFKESRTSDYFAGKLESVGVPYHWGLTGTGMVATLSRGQGPSIGLRASVELRVNNGYPAR